MSLVYPPPRYTGDSGEVSATYRPATTPPDHVSTPVISSGPTVGQGVEYHYLATTGSTDGDFGLYRIDMGPAPTGPTTHFHRGISESFFTLSGTTAERPSPARTTALGTTAQGRADRPVQPRRPL
ncbi:hypothetical protein ABZ801_03660 [Actinomadura sp. NPDC047616]|uniref:hypothetical protein n=1 Tax=Actinomadura sp. NPDC047616 TaxID=3155914 RepID=UPI0033D35C65